MIPDRSYSGPDSIEREYDAWTGDGVLERYWGDHIHHGYYPDARVGRTDFRAAKADLIERLLSLARLGQLPKRVVDVGCGIGGSTRYLARKYDCEATGITLSPAQVARARALTSEETKASFQVADALQLPFEDGHFDLVWSCESGEHMPDKAKFFGELCRVLAPGGTLILATWCHRAEPPPLGKQETQRLAAIYRAWALPFFVPLEAYVSMAQARGLNEIQSEDWSHFTAPTWRHQIRLGLRDLPWLLWQGPQVVARSLRDAWAVKDMIRGFEAGTIVYGVVTARQPHEH